MDLGRVEWTRTTKDRAFKMESKRHGLWRVPLALEKFGVFRFLQLVNPSDVFVGDFLDSI